MSDQPNTANFPDVHSWVSAHKHEPEKVADLIVWQRKQLDQLANFNPDWDVLKATQDSLNAHMKRLSKAQDKVDELEGLPCKDCGHPLGTAHECYICRIGKQQQDITELKAENERLKLTNNWKGRYVPATENELRQRHTTLITELRNMPRFMRMQQPHKFGRFVYYDDMTALLDKEQSDE